MRRFTNLFLSLSAASVAVATAQTTKVTGTVSLQTTILP